MSHPGVSKSWRSGQVMVVVVILLYIATFVNFAMDLLLMSSGFISYGPNIWTRYLRAVGNNNIMKSIGLGITGVICNILADSAMVCAMIMEIWVMAYFHRNSRFGVVGWSGDSTFRLLYFQLFA